MNLDELIDEIAIRKGEWKLRCDGAIRHAKTCDCLLAHIANETFEVNTFDSDNALRAASAIGISVTLADDVINAADGWHWAEAEEADSVSAELQQLRKRILKAAGLEGA